MENNTFEATVNAVRFFLEEKDHISTELTVTHPDEHTGDKKKIESGISNYVKKEGGRYSVEFINNSESIIAAAMLYVNDKPFN